MRSGALLAPAGEFAFVLLPLGGGARHPDAAQASQLATALAAMTMLLGPVAAKALDERCSRARRAEPELEPDSFAGAGGRVLVIGFGRFGQVVTQVLLAQGVDVTVIDKDVERIRGAAALRLPRLLRRWHPPRRAARRRGGAGRGDLHLRR